MAKNSPPQQSGTIHPVRQANRAALALEAATILETRCPDTIGDELAEIIATDHESWTLLWKVARPNRKTAPSPETRAMIVDLLRGPTSHNDRLNNMTPDQAFQGF